MEEKYVFKCPNCGEQFEKEYKDIFLEGHDSDVCYGMVVCPNCNQTITRILKEDY